MKPHAEINCVCLEALSCKAWLTSQSTTTCGVAAAASPCVGQPERVLEHKAHCLRVVLRGHAAAHHHEHIRWTRAGPYSRYCSLLTHIWWKEPSEARIDPPTQAEWCCTTGPRGMCTLTFRPCGQTRFSSLQHSPRRFSSLLQPPDAAACPRQIPPHTPRMVAEATGASRPVERRGKG